MGETAGSPLPGTKREGFANPPAPYVDVIGSAPSDAFLMEGGFVEDSAKWLQEKKK